MKAKDKVQKIRQHRNRTGGGPQSDIFLSDVEEKIVQIIGLFSADGDTQLMEIGFDDSNESKSYS